jgi:hypothetical protein
LPIQIVHAPDWARRNVRRQRQCIGGHRLRLWPHCSERMKVIAPADARQLPERLRDDAEIVG